MPLSREELETPRSPSQLKEFVERVRERVLLDAEERGAGFRRRGYYKQFLDEVQPLSRFAALAYREDHTVQPVLGNQDHDAIVRDAEGRIVDKVEIANPFDGKAALSTGRAVVERGIGGFRVGSPGDDIEELIPIIANTASKKALKDYSDTTVVFNVSALAPFRGFETRHEAQIQRIRQTLAAAGLKAKRVYVLLGPNQIDRLDG